MKRLDNGVKTEFCGVHTPVGEGLVWMELRVKGRQSRCSWSSDGENRHEIGPTFDTGEFSDEYSDYGEFTGCFAVLTCSDRMLHQRYADFDFFTYRDLEPDLLRGEGEYCVEEG